MNILLVLCTLIVSVMSKTVTIKEYEGHGCEGEPKSTSTYEITMGCTSGNAISSFQSTCDMYSFKLTYEMFLGSTTCEKQCSSSLCYDKTEMYVCLVLVLPLSLSLVFSPFRTHNMYPSDRLTGILVTARTLRTMFWELRRIQVNTQLLIATVTVGFSTSWLRWDFSCVAVYLVSAATTVRDEGREDKVFV